MIKKMLMLSSSTLTSRLLGFIRDMACITYLGVGATADAFWTAFRLPNSLRKVFAEGALSAALVPTLVRVVKQEGCARASHIVTPFFIAIELAVLALCALVAWQASPVLCFVAPGFSQEQIMIAVPLLRILIFFIFFISSSAIFAGALAAVNSFSAPALGQVLFNTIAIGAALGCWYFALPVTALAVFFVCGGAVQLFLHAYSYWRRGFVFSCPTIPWSLVHEISRKFFPCLLSVGVVELHLFIDAQFASYLPVGSISLLFYASSFMRLPLGVLVVPFCTILLSKLSTVATYAPKRLSYYLFESVKLTLWALMPVIGVMIFFSRDIFYTLYAGPNFSYEQVLQAQLLLIIMLLGLIFFSINKIMLNIFYALHETWVPTVITAVATILNTLLNYILMSYWGVYGIAAATTLAAAVQTMICYLVLKQRYHFVFYSNRLARFAFRLMCVIVLFAALFFLLLYGMQAIVMRTAWSRFLTESFGLWLWVGPLVLLLALFFFLTRNLFGLKLHFLDTK